MLRECSLKSAFHSECTWKSRYLSLTVSNRKMRSNLALPLRSTCNCQHKRSETLPSCFYQLTNRFYKFWTVLWLYITAIPFTRQSSSVIQRKVNRIVFLSRFRTKSSQFSSFPVPNAYKKLFFRVFRFQRSFPIFFMIYKQLFRVWNTKVWNFAISNC